MLVGDSAGTQKVYLLTRLLRQFAGIGGVVDKILGQRLELVKSDVIADIAHLAPQLTCCVDTHIHHITFLDIDLSVFLVLVGGLGHVLGAGEPRALGGAGGEFEHG